MKFLRGSSDEEIVDVKKNLPVAIIRGLVANPNRRIYRMDAEQTLRSANPNCSDETDLVELFHNLCQQKLLIIVITLVVMTAAAGAYAYLSPPVYEARVSVLPPQLSDIAGYNVGVETYNFGRGWVEFDRFAVSDVYELFKTNLQSSSLKKTFFHEISFPSSLVINIYIPEARKRPDIHEGVVWYHSPKRVAKWANLYVEMIKQKSKQDTQKNMFGLAYCVDKFGV